jgi:hypothetical protein
MDKFIKSKLLRADLVEIDRQLLQSGFGDIASMLLIKQLFLTIANLVDFELTVRPMYAQHRGLSAVFNKGSKSYDFCKYLRNKFVGHVKPELLAKAVEWNPQLRYFLKKTDDPEVMYMYNLWILETAINTYVTADEVHKIFDSETDLEYPPDIKRFLKFLSHVVKSSIEYLDALGAAIGESIQMADPDMADPTQLAHAITAGQTTFEYIKK